MGGPSATELHRAFLASRELVVEASGDGAVAEVGRWQVYDSATGLAELNQAMPAGEATPKDAGAAEAWYAARGAPYCVVLRDPVDAALIASLGAQGWRLARSQPVMARGLPLPAAAVPGVEFVEVRTVEEAMRFLEVRRDPAARRPPEGPEAEFIARMVASGRARYLVGLVEGHVAGTVTTLRVGRIVLVSNVFVRPESRRRRLGTALTEAAANAWPGESHVGLEASAQGELLYGEMGFTARFRYVRLVR